jgi:hypothetical protein
MHEYQRGCNESSWWYDFFDQQFTNEVLTLNRMGGGGREIEKRPKIQGA